MTELRPSIISLRLERNDGPVVAFLGSVSRDSYPQLDENATAFLHENELRYFSSRRFKKRRMDYLTGCYIAKSVVGAYLNEPDLVKIEIESGVFNQPVVRYAGWNTPGVSLSHSHEWSVALSFPLGHPMALDIEKLGLHKLDVLKKQMTRSEIDLIEKRDGDKATGYCQIWTMKEALSKVLGCGLTTPFSVLEINRPNFKDNGDAQCYFKNFGQYICHSWIINGYAFSIVLPRTTALELDAHVLFFPHPSRPTQRLSNIQTP